jgi:hypothetical protein
MTEYVPSRGAREWSPSCGAIRRVASSRGIELRRRVVPTKEATRRGGILLRFFSLHRHACEEEEEEEDEHFRRPEHASPPFASWRIETVASF